ARLLYLKRFLAEAEREGGAAPPPQALPQLSTAVAYALQQLVNAIALAAVYALLATAYSLIYGLVGRINLAFGEIAALGAYGAIGGVAAAVAVLGLAAAIGVLLLLSRTRFGRAWRAFADDPGTAALFGVDGRRLLASTFLLAGLLAGLAGWIVAAYYGNISFSLGAMLGLKA